MSHTYRKVPIIKDSSASSHAFKKIASRITRNKINRGDFDEIGMGPNTFKRLYEQWDIHDYVSYNPINEERHYINEVHRKYLRNGCKREYLYQTTWYKMVPYEYQGKIAYTSVKETFKEQRLLFKELTFEEFSWNCWCRYKKDYICR